MSSFWNGFNKAASAERPEQHNMRRFFLGNPVSAAIEARKGEKLKAFGHATGHVLKETGKGTAVGAAGGALLGGAASLLSKGKIHPGQGAAAGGILGGIAGGQVGSVKGHMGAEASRIHGAHSKNNPVTEKAAAALPKVLKKDHPQWMIMAAQRAAKKVTGQAKKVTRK